MIAIPRYQHVSSGGLALMVHGLFFLALIVGVSWKNLPQLPVEAELWTALPEPVPAPEPPPERVPEPLPMPPAPPEPVAETKPELPDIALEQEKKRRAEAARQAEASKQEILKRQAEEAARAEQARLEQERAERERLAQEKDRLEQERQEKLKREQVRRQVEQEVARQMQEALDTEAAQLRAQQARAQAARRASTIDDFKRRIQVKIQSYVRLPPKLAGNPEAEFRVSLLPNGEVLRATLVRGSGQAAYDVEVERAILKASPLPLPNEKELAASFRDNLTLRFRPYDETGRVN